MLTDGKSFSACTSPVQFTSANITDGTHTFEVLSVDNSTNKDPSPASFIWTVDTIPPETSILSAIDGMNLLSRQVRIIVKSYLNSQVTTPVVSELTILNAHLMVSFSACTSPYFC